MNGNMFAAKPVWPAYRSTFQPPRSPAVQRRQVIRGLGLRNPVLGQAASPLLADIIGISLAAATTYVGIRAGLNDKGFPSVLGWVVGISAGLGLAMGVLGILVDLVPATAPKATTPVPGPVAMEESSFV